MYRNITITVYKHIDKKINYQNRQEFIKRCRIIYIVNMNDIYKNKKCFT